MSGVYCSVVKCTSSTDHNKNIKFFPFPRDAVRCRLWVDASGRKDLMHLAPRSIQRSYIVCQKHFKPSDFVDGKLKMSAIPSLRLNKEMPRSRMARRESEAGTPSPPPVRARASASQSLPTDEAAAGSSQTTRRSARKLEQNKAKKGNQDADKKKESKAQK